jgi:DNA polymerase III subunit gamma/tau
MTKHYQPLATKYRPQTFEDVVGQDVVTTTLKNALELGRISHAYLFSGMRGVGKTTAARVLAKCLNCRSVEEPTVQPCCTCDSCTEIAAGRSIDVLEIDAASNTSVDDVRALQENLIYAPARDRYKVYIVDEVHMLSKSAFNAFLKTLEEPPGHVVFIFATTEINRIPPTVLSRCLIFDFGRVSAASIFDRLSYICTQEHVAVEKSALDLIVFQSEGSIRDAISALDQVINFAGGQINYDKTLKALGLVDRDILLSLMNGIIEQNATKAFEAMRSVADSGADMRLFCRHLIRHVRDMLMARIGGKNKELLPYSEAEIELLHEQGQKVSEEDLTRFFDILVRADEEMQLSAAPQYNLEAAVVKMIHSTRLKPLVELIARLESGEIKQHSVAPRTVPREQSLDFGGESPKMPSAPAGNPKDRLLVATRGSAIHGPLKMAKAVSLDGDILVITVGTAIEVSLFSEGSKRAELLEAARKAFGDSVHVRVVNGGKTADVEDENQSLERADEELPLPDESEMAAGASAEEQDSDFNAGSSENAPKEHDTELEQRIRQNSAANRLFDDLNLEIIRDNLRIKEE